MNIENANVILDRLISGLGLRRDKQLADLLGVTAQAISQARRKGKIPDRWILQAASEFRLSPDWLLSGAGPVLSDKAEPIPAKIPAPRSETVDQTAAATPALTRYMEKAHPRPDAPVLEMALIPLVEATLAAGSGSLQNGGEVLNYFAFRQNWLLRKGNPDRMVLMKVFGDSMEPEICHGDMVLINQGHTQIYGHAIYAVGVNDEIYIKQVESRPGGTLILRSHNARYDPIEVSLHGDLADSVRIIGRVIWWCREA